jgi:hypothetical protein
MNKQSIAVFIALLVIVMINSVCCESVQTYSSQGTVEFNVKLDNPSGLYVIMSPSDSDLSLMSNKQPEQIEHNVKITHLIPGHKYNYSIFTRSLQGVAVVQHGSITVPSDSF